MTVQNIIKININMRCIEMMEPTRLNMDKVWININMRCIEILEQNFITLYNYVININMRCIEMLQDSNINKSKSRRDNFRSIVN